jgi:LacI family transcriptional regulator
MTVSNFVNGRLVRQRNRERVARAIQKLSYRPHVHARSLRLSRGWAIGMLVITHKNDFVTMQFMSKLVAGLSGFLNEHGYGLLLHNISPDRLDNSILLKRAHTDALVVILSGPDSEREAVLARLLRLNQPVIALQETMVPRAGQDFAVVKQDDFGGAVMLAEHLVSLGARSLVFIEPDFGWPAISERLRGITSVLKRHEGAKLRVVKCKEEAYEYVEGVVLRDLAKNSLPDAYIGGNELLTLATLTILEGAGHRIPQDVVLTGFNAFEFWFFAKRKITTIASPAYEIGVRAGRLILERLTTGRFAKKLDVLPISLTIGDTTSGALPAEGVVVAS